LYNPDGSIILSDGGSGTGGLLGRSAILQTAGVPAQDALPAMVQSRLDMFEVLHGQSGLMSREGPQEPKTGRLAPRP
ncbi:MAG: hypothetical protein WCG06_04940, partial [Candidatus Omnitrophota bacterium]